MKKAVIIILIIAALICGSVFAYKKFNIHIDFIDNYAQNFSDNLFNLKLQHEMKKIEKQENSADNTVDADLSESGTPENTDSPDYADNTQEPEVSQAPDAAEDSAKAKKPPFPASMKFLQNQA